jgi:metal-responsive CopG/Arc/MetJ family transcriptional regulator
MKVLSVHCPEALAERLDQLVRDGWITDPGQAVVEALRRFLDSHRPELMEAQLMSDVEWGLHGRN